MSSLPDQKFDVVVMGGGIVGSSVAYHLMMESPTLSVAVIEPDPTYEFASALRASGGCRVQFTCPENIQMSTYIQDRVEAAEVDDIKVKSVTLASGQTLRADAFVNATGAWSGLVAEKFGMTLPITPLRRFEHYFTAGTPVERLPYVKDVNRMAFRSEGNGFSGGLVDGSAQHGFNFDVDHDYFERVMWPAVAERFPAFEAAKCHRTWSGLYEVNELDDNPVIGAWNHGSPNLFTVAGFSGHGMMHAPAAGRGIAELVVQGKFQTLDLTRLGYERVVAGKPYAEAGIL